MATIDDFNVNVLPDGDKKVYFLGRYYAHKVVEEENIDWSYAKMFTVPKTGCIPGGVWDIRIHYFNSDDKEVASYDIDMEILTFLATPRTWVKEYINNMNVCYDNRMAQCFDIDTQQDFCSTEDNNYKGRPIPRCQFPESPFIFMVEPDVHGISAIHDQNELGEWPVHCVKGSK